MGSLKKPSKNISRMSRELFLPNPINRPTHTRVFIFVKDQNKKGTLITEEKGSYLKSIGIDTIIGLSKMHTNYASFRAKRRLCSEYDVFLVDDRITSYILREIGSSFSF